MIVLFLRVEVSDDVFDGLVLFQHLLMVTSALESIFCANILGHQCMWSLFSFGFLIFQEKMTIFDQETHVLVMLTLNPVPMLTDHSLFMPIRCLFVYIL